MELEKMFISLLFDEKGVKKSADNVEGIVKDFAKKAVGALAVFASMNWLKGTVDELVDSAIAMNKLAISTNSNVEAMGALEAAVKTVGGSAEDVNSSMQNLGKSIKETSATGKMNDATNILKSLGIATKTTTGELRKTDEVLLDLSGKFEGLSAKKQADLGKKIGLDENTIKLLGKGKAGLEALIEQKKKDGVVTQHQIDLAKENRELNDKINAGYKQTRASIAEMLLPYVNKFLDLTIRLSDYLKEHKGLVVGFFGALATVITARAIPAILRMAVAMWANPITWMIAGLVALGAAIALLVDDFMVWKEGGESAFGGVWAVAYDFFTKIQTFVMDNIQRFKDFGKVVAIGIGAILGFKVVVAVFTVIRNALNLTRIAMVLFNSVMAINPFVAVVTALIVLIGLIYTFRTEIWDFVQGVGNWFSDLGNRIYNGVSNGVNKLVSVFTNIKTTVMHIWDTIVAYISSKFDWITSKVKAISSFGDKAKDLLGIGSNDKTKANNGTQQIHQTIQPSAKTNIPATATSNNTSNISKNQTTSISAININVPSGDPVAIAGGISGALKSNNGMMHDFASSMLVKG